MKLFTSVIALALLPSLTSAATTTRARYLMGTVCEVEVGESVDAENDIARAFGEAERVERLLSTWREDSELSRLNRGDEPAPSTELRALLDLALRWRDRTGGAFEPRVRPLIDVWRTRDEGALPDRTAIDAALRAIRSGSAPFEEGGFGKGYALDRMLGSIDARHAVINFGGQLAVRGAVTVTIADPERRDVPVVSFTLRDASLSTSSGSEKTFVVAGHRFSHLIDPRTGQALPPRGSVSVIAADALSADILSTALYVMGERDGLRWAGANGVAAAFINSSHEIRVSASMRARVRDLEMLDRKFKLKE